MKSIPLYIFLAMTLASCSASYLTVQTDYLSHKNLASYYVGTPDPRQNYPTIGERLIIYWSVPKELLCYDDLHLEVTIRFRNREEVVEVFNIHKTRGTYIFALLNDDYLYHRGILTYKIDLVGGGYVFEEWRHQIWANLIEIPFENCSAPCPTADGEEEEYPINWDE